MATAPSVTRNGDSWELLFTDEAIAIGVERLRESSDGLHAEVVVQSGAGNERRGHIWGPVKLNLLSSESQTRLANVLIKRVNHVDWHGMLVATCNKVSGDFRAPSPTLNLAEMPDEGGVEYLVPGLVPARETTMLYGDGSSGKSLTAMRIALSVATGCPLPWGASCGEPQEVLYLDWETNAATVRRRFKALVGDDDLPTIHYRGADRQGGMLRSLEDELPALREQIARLKIGFVVVDSIGFAASGPLNEDQTARAALTALRALSPASRLVVAHISQESARATSGPVRPFGSAFFWNGMRSGIEMRKAEDQATPDVLDVALYHRKSNDGALHKPIGLRIQFRPDGIINYVPQDVGDVPELAERTSLSSRLGALLRSGAKTTEELAEALDAKPGTVRVTLGRMSNVIQLRPGGGRGQQGAWGLSDAR